MLWKGGVEAVKRLFFYVFILALCLTICIGYAAVSDGLSITGDISALAPAMPDVYITGVSPSQSSGVTINNYNGTTVFATVNSNGTATFAVNVINISDKVYVFDRVIDGAELDFEGVYSGTEITYTLIGLSRLDEIAPGGGTLSFSVSIAVPRGVSAENYILKFNFIEKTGTEILPGNDEYDVTFKYNNGQADQTVKVHENEFVPRPEPPTWVGYEFLGWYVDSSFSTAWNFEADRVTGPMTLYARWAEVVPSRFNVIFLPNNGASSYTVTVDAGALVPVQPSPTREGYSFIGWYTDQACTDAWNFDTDKVYSSTVLYGGWEIYVPPVPPDCNITFKPNNGEPDRTIIVLTGDFIRRPTAPIRAGYVFMGWYIDEACTVAWNFEVDRAEGHTVLYGGWDIEHVIESVEYDITFEPNNGSPSSFVTVEQGERVPRPPLPEKEGYTFIGWYTDSSLSTAWNFDTDYPTSDMTLYGGWEKGEAPSHDEEMHSDFMGLVQALLSDSNNCLNHSDLIFDSVMESLNSKKRPKEDAPILHCSVNSVSGGTMSAIATYANSKLTSNIHFIFEVDPDPQYRNKRMRLYMYYGDECAAANDGDEIMVYQQIVTRGDDGVWFADGTYIGRATVGDYFGGGNSGKDVKTVSPYTWKAGLPEEN